MGNDLTNVFETAIEQESSASVENITARACTSDDYSGIQYNFFGHFIPIRPIIDVVAEIDDVAIEQIYHVDDGKCCLGVFVADLPEQGHPAFID